MEYKKANSVKLRDAGKDERWLQDRIDEDPSILGLGDLTVFRREKIQAGKGRIDFVLSDPDNEDLRYEVEVMLGKLNESHIIRAIEYWDIERRRYPSLDHRAVIVAEDITNRFFNVIGLMNKSIPIIAVQLNAFTHENNLFLNFVKVLDLTETMDEEEEPQEGADRKYWEGRAHHNSIAVVDALIGIIRYTSEPRVTYNKTHIAIGTTGRNFMWCHPRKAQHLRLGIRVGEDREGFIKKFEDVGIQCSKGHLSERVKLTLITKEVEENKELIAEVLSIAEEVSRQ